MSFTTISYSDFTTIHGLTPIIWALSCGEVELLTTAQDKLFSILKHDVFSLGRLQLAWKIGYSLLGPLNFFWVTIIYSELSHETW